MIFKKMVQWVLVAGCSIAWTASHAIVNLKNGNFFIAYDDLVVSEESGLRISRHYNSLSGTKGWFGWGWGTEFETRLTVMPEGRIAVRENGNAHVTIYGDASSAQVNAAVDQILVRLREQRLVLPDGEVPLRDQLANDLLLRLHWTERLGLTGPAPTEGNRMRGAEFESGLDRLARVSDSELLAMALKNRDGSNTLLKAKHAYLAIQAQSCGYLLRTREGYERGTCSNQRVADMQKFDANGRLTQLNAGGGWLTLAYGQGRNPKRIIDRDGRAIELTWSADGLLTQIAATIEGKRRETDFTYDASGHLVKSDAHTANVYRYQYDTQHHLTRIDYADNTAKVLQYDAQGRVVSVTHPDGQQAVFAYADDLQGNTETVHSLRSAGELKELRRVRYTKDGKMLLDRDALNSMEYEYHPTWGTVTLYRRNNSDCNYRYDDNGRVAHESCLKSNEFNSYSYDAEGRMSKALLSVPLRDQGRLGDRPLVLLTQFDTQGRLTRVAESGSPIFATVRYLSDEDRHGVVEVQGVAPDDQEARLLFGRKANVLDRALKALEQRTRIHEGFVIVKEVP